MAGKQVENLRRCIRMATLPFNLLPLTFPRSLAEEMGTLSRLILLIRER